MKQDLSEDISIYIKDGISSVKEAKLREWYRKSLDLENKLKEAKKAFRKIKEISHHTLPEDKSTTLEFFDKFL
jgi:hypothetical protein